jgi:hypothetical protein
MASVFELYSACVRELEQKLQIKVELAPVGEREFQRRLASMSKKRREAYRASLQAFLANPNEAAKEVQSILVAMSQGAQPSPEVRDRLINSPFRRKNMP